MFEIGEEMGDRAAVVLIEIEAIIAHDADAAINQIPNVGTAVSKPDQFVAVEAEYVEHVLAGWRSADVAVWLLGQVLVVGVAFAGIRELETDSQLLRSRPPDALVTLAGVAAIVEVGILEFEFGKDFFWLKSGRRQNYRFLAGISR